jgi:excisionase family DNA binding protein
MMITGDNYTTVEAAALMDVSPWTIRKLIQKGKLHAERPLRDYVISAAELQRYIATTKFGGRNRMRR